MNLKSEQNLSMDELMAMNRPPHMGEAMPEQTAPVMPAIEIHCPIPETMDNLENRLCRQEICINTLAEMCSQSATKSQMEELMKAVKHLELMTEQAGKPKERYSWRRRFRLPRLRLSFPEWDWPTVATVLMALAAALLLLLWFKLDGDWSRLSLLHR